MNSKSRAAAFLVVAATAFVLAQTASAAELGISVGVQDGTLEAATEIAAPATEASAEASVVPDPAAPSISAAVEAGPVAARLDVHPRPAVGAGPAGPAERAHKSPGARTKGPAHRVRSPRDRSIVATASSEGAAPRLDPAAPLTTRAARTGTPPNGVAPLPDRSTGGWKDSVQAAAAGISGSPVALVGLLLAIVSLTLRRVLGAVAAPRPSLYSFVLQRPG